MYKCIECGKCYWEYTEICTCGGITLNYFEYYMEDEEE